MSTFMYSTIDSEEFNGELSKTDHETCTQNFGDITSNTRYLENIIEVKSNSSKPYIPEEFNIQNETIPEDFICVKPQLKEVSEISPFKQAVKGFVINKLSKKVGSSHILYGLTEKIVKKLEEKDPVPGPVQIQKKTQVVPLVESSSESSFQLSPCELKSMVECDFPESSSVEEATECFEEFQSLIEDTDTSHKQLFKAKKFSKSLPCTPSHQLNAMTSTYIDNSFDSEENSLSEIADISSNPSKIFQNAENETQTDKSNEIELQTISKEETDEVKTASVSGSVIVTYPENFYTDDSKERKKPERLKQWVNVFHKLKTVTLSLPWPYVFLLTSVIVHNLKFLSTIHFDYIFDSFILAYIIYILVGIWIETQDQNVPPILSYTNDHFETTAIDMSDIDKTLKGSVKILKGEYDPEKIDGFTTEAVNLHVANHCLKISRPYLNDEDVCLPTEIYDLCGAKVTLVPHNLKKKRLFLNKYPICLTLPLASKKLEDTSGTYDDLMQKEKTDFISLVELEDGLVERPKQRAIYIFALTNREKEAWFHALTKCLTTCDSNFVQNMPLVNASPKLDFSSLSYASLMEMNTDESLAVSEDDSSTNTELKLSSSEKELYVSFEDYMKILWESYQKVLHLSSPTDENRCTAKKMEGEFRDSCCVEWLNVAVGRLFYDFLTQKKWGNEVIVRIQKKLDKIEMPNFVETLQVTDICMGSNLPQLHAVSNPSIDNFGIWFDFDFTYSGSFCMTLKTRLKIPKDKPFKASDDQENESSKQNADGNDASEEDGSGSKRSPNKFINKIEKWMTHKHFQTVAQSKFVKKYVGDISNMPLTLTVEVNKLEGILSINIPPAPTDRIWFGFHKDPVLSITASPKVGSKEINLSAIVQMIERQLVEAFKKALVMPHMDDLVIPILHSPLCEGE